MARLVEATLSLAVRRIRVQTIEAERDASAVVGFDGLSQGSVGVTLGQLDFRDAAARALDAGT